MPLRSGEHDAWVEERAGDAGSDGDQIALSIKNLDLRSAGHFRQIHGTPAANERCAFVVGGDARQVWHQFSRMDKQRLSASLLHGGLECFDRVSVVNRKFSDGGAAQAGQGSTASEFLAHFVGYGPDIRSGGYAGTESRLMVGAPDAG